MIKLTQEQISAVTEWMCGWEQLEGTAIPIRFKEHFTEKLNMLDESFPINWEYVEICDACNGSKSECKKCGGKGFVKDTSVIIETVYTLNTCTKCKEQEFKQID